MFHMIDTKKTESEVEAEVSASPLERRLFGAFILVGIIGLSALFSGRESITFEVGYSIGKLLASLALALPIFVIYSYFTNQGKIASTVKNINWLLITVSMVYIFISVLNAFVPSLIREIIDKEYARLPICDNPFAKYNSKKPTDCRIE